MKKALTKYALKNKFRVENGASAFKRCANNLKLVNKHFEGEQGLSMIVHQKSVLQDFLKQNRNMKLNIRTEAIFSKPELFDDGDDDLEESEILKHLPSARFNIHNDDDLTQAIEDSVKQILLQIEKLEATKSNLKFKRAVSITIHYDKYDPTRAGRYIELPRFIKLKKACVNIKNEDNKCLKYCVQSIVYDKINNHHPEAMFHYKNLNDDIINWNGINFPAGNKDIDRLETNNNGLISINVYEPDDLLNEDKVIKTKTTKVQNAKYHIDLLKFFDEKDNYHFAIVKNISRLLSNQANNAKTPKHFCRYCCHPFTTEKGLNKHYSDGCKSFDGQNFKLPDKGSYIEFQKYNTKLECPFVIYCDFECLTVNSNEPKPCGYIRNISGTQTLWLYDECC